ncbi:MAG: hypothetical protein KGQ49_05665, partial [Verrucomicrobia bacterium]|nr:hypothetical protein [Verrucomicrobiota bacterium]
MAKKKKTPINPDAQGLFFFSVGALALLALWSFTFLHPDANWLGYVGYIAALGLESLFGLGAYLIPCYFMWLGVRLLKGHKLVHADHIYFSILLSSVCMLFTVFAESYPDKAHLWDGKVLSETLALSSPFPHTLIRFYLGGFPFYYVFTDLPGINFQNTLSPVGTTLIFFSFGLVAFLLLTRIEVVANAKSFWMGIKALVAWTGKWVQKKPGLLKAEKTFTGLKINHLPPEPKKKLTDIIIKPEKKAKLIEPAKKEAQIVKKEAPAVAVKNLMVRSDHSYQLPNPDLLADPNRKVDQPALKKDLMHQAAILEETLK